MVTRVRVLVWICAKLPARSTDTAPGKPVVTFYSREISTLRYLLLLSYDRKPGVRSKLYTSLETRD